MDWQSADIAKKYRAGEVLTGPFGLHLITQCGLRDRADGSEKLVVLDNACGTGVVTLNLYNTLPVAAKANLEVVCGDFSPGMVKSVQERIEHNGWTGASAKLIDAQRMDLPSNHFTHVFTNFALVGIPNPRACLAETFRVLRPSGTAAFTVWQYVGWYPIAADAVASIPDAPPLPSFEDFAKVFLETPGDDWWTDPAFLESELRKVGFEDVQTVMHKNETSIKNAEEYMTLHASMTKTILGNVWNEGEKMKVEPFLDAALLKVLKAKFGDGEISLNWEAWCVTAKAPKLEQ